MSGKQRKDHSLPAFVLADDKGILAQSVNKLSVTRWAVKFLEMMRTMAEFPDQQVVALCQVSDDGTCYMGRCGSCSSNLNAIHNSFEIVHRHSSYVLARYSPSLPEITRHDTQ